MKKVLDTPDIVYYNGEAVTSARIGKPLPRKTENVPLYGVRNYCSERNEGGLPMKTFMASPATIDRKWYVVDAEGQTLGRLASEVAKVLRGKNKPIYTPHVDCGDNVIIVNAEKIVVTGKKLDQKIYYHHSGWVGGMKETTLREMLQKKPEQVVELAVKGMLPKGPLGREMYTKLHVYAGAEHPHAAQKPEVLTF
jgi:large subunit ribosomal protein L13